MVLRQVRIISALSFFAGLMLLPALSIGVQGLHPVEGKLLCCKYVLFVWDQHPQAASYQLQVAVNEGDLPFEENLVVDVMDPTNAAIIKSGIDFGNSYVWRTRPMIDNEGEFDWSGIHRFRVIDLPDSVRSAFEPDIYIPEEVEPGITISAPYGVPVGFELNGDVMWYLPGGVHWYLGQWALSQLINGNFISLHRGGIRIFNVDNDTLRHIVIPELGTMHHDVIPKSDGNFLTLVLKYRWIPSNESDSLYWQGDEIAEITPNGDVVWRWSCWDHFSIEDFDSLEIAQVPNRGLFDWTHCNACPLNQEEDAIYLSVRNLSRVVKIAYPQGDIIWSMGREMPSGDVTFGSNLNFRRQHAPEPQPDGSLLLYDNHWELDGENAWSRAMLIGIDFEREDVATIDWQFRHDFSRQQGDTDRLPNGNILVNPGSSFHFYEISPNDEIVWAVHPTLVVGNYRAKRIPSMYPLVFTVTTPPDSGEMPVHQTYVHFRINNEGELTQSFRYHVRDSNGWLEQESGLVEIQPGRSVYVVALGYAPPVDIWDEVTLTVEPVVAQEMVEIYCVHLHPGPAEASPEELVFLPGKFELFPNFPNPFNSQTTISFDLTRSCLVEVQILDNSGRTVKQLFNGTLDTGVNSFTWNGTDSFETPVAGGSYYYIVNVDRRQYQGRVTLIK